MKAIKQHRNATPNGIRSYYITDLNTLLCNAVKLKNTYNVKS